MSGFEPRISANCATIIAQSFFKNGLKPASFCLFSFFSNDKYSTHTIHEKSVDGVLGTRTRCRMVGADESTDIAQSLCCL